VALCGELMVWLAGPGGDLLHSCGSRGVMPMSPIRRFYLAKLGWLAFVAPIPLFAVSMDQRLATFSLVAAILVGVCGELYCLWMLRCPTCDSPIAHRGRLYPGNGPERFCPVCRRDLAQR
jgi:hypothetical protein